MLTRLFMMIFMETAILMQLLSKRVKNLRKNKTLTQKELASQAQVSQSSISNLESDGGLGRTSVTLETANEVAKVFGVELWQLLLPDKITISDDEITVLINKFSQSQPEGRSDILKIADLVAKYQK